MELPKLKPGDSVHLVASDLKLAWIYKVKSTNYFDLDVTDPKATAVDITIEALGICDLLVRNIRLVSDGSVYLNDCHDVLMEGKWKLSMESVMIEVYV